MLRFVLVLLVVGACGASYPAMAATYYIADTKGPDGVAGTADDADASNSYPGTQAKPFATLGKACQIAAAGDTVSIRGGVYRETLRPTNSGVPGRPIVFRACEGEQVLIRDAPGLKDLTPDEAAADQAGRQYGIYIYGKSHITVAGISVASVQGWSRVVRSRRIVIRDCRFTGATARGTTGSLKVVHGENVIIRGNVFEDGNDNILLIHSDHNLVERNRVTRGRHTLWCIRAGSFNVVRDNYFHNALQKIGEVYDAEADPPIRYDCTRHNLIQGNVFACTPSSGNASPYAGIQYAGQEGIIRHNVFHSMAGPGLDLALYADEARFNMHNRIYQNVFHATSFAGLSISGAPKHTFADNIILNNILTASTFVANDRRWTWYTRDLNGKPVQMLTGRLDGFLFERNNLYDSRGQELYLITLGARNSGKNPPPRAIAWFEANHPNVFRGSLHADPRYVDEAGRDFHLRPDSPMIDAGVFLTRAVGSGRGTVLPVKDARYFSDGFGILDEDGRPLAGDLVQLEGDERTARVVAIDYAAHTLTLDQVLAWKDGQGVALRYAGRGPDLGAFEFTGTENQRPVASFTAVPEAARPMTVACSAAGSFDPDGAVARYDWDWGDGQTTPGGQAAGHTYADAGEYLVTLKVTDNGTPARTAEAAVPVRVGMPVLAVAPASLDFGPLETGMTFTVRNSGTGTLVYTVEAPQAARWLNVRAVSGTCTSKTDTHRVAVNREGLAPDVYTGTITVAAGAGGTVSLPVCMEVPATVTETLIEVGSPWRYLKGNFTPAAGWYAAWPRPDFDDLAWAIGRTGIGFSDGDVTYATVLDDMNGSYIAFYMRSAFTIADPAAVVGLTLEAAFDDGFVAYVNGVEVLRVNMGGVPGSPVDIRTAAKAKNEEQARPNRRYPLALGPRLLRSGRNVLAIEVHNATLKSSDAGMVPRLKATVARVAEAKVPQGAAHTRDPAR